MLFRCDFIDQFGKRDSLFVDCEDEYEARSIFVLKSRASRPLLDLEGNADGRGQWKLMNLYRVKSKNIKKDKGGNPIWDWI